jgi:FAD/FMN-containing dehydrogenase
MGFVEPSPEVDELAARLGPGAVLTAADGLDAYTEPARRVPGTPAGRAAAVVRPADTDGVRTVVAWAREHRVRLLPQGANTGLVGASTPDATGGVVVLSTERLGGTEVDPVDRTAVVGAGERLGRLNDLLAPHGLWFPIDLAADPTVGGMVATNTGGARMIRHGDVRRHVLGLEVVLADEAVTVVDDLSVLRKDNTGLPLTDLFVGSSGALGVITRVSLDLDLLPTARATAMLSVPVGTGAADAGDLIVLLERHLGEHLSALEAMSAEAVAMAVERVPGVRSPFGPDTPAMTVLIEVSSTTSLDAPGAADLDRLLVGALDAAASTGLVDDGLLVPPADAWALRHALTEGLRRSGVVLGFDVSMPRRALTAFRAEVRAAVTAAVPRAVVADFGHWGDGGLHCNVVVPADRPPDDDERQRIRGLVYGATIARGGSFSAEHGVGPLNADLWRRLTPDGARSLGRRLKRLADPLGILGHPGLPY